MKVKIHPADLQNTIELSKIREEVKGRVDGGTLKKGDVRLSWNDGQEKLTIDGRDIEF